MAGEQVLEAANPNPGNTANSSEVLLAQLGPQDRQQGGSLADQILRGTGGTPAPAERPPAPVTPTPSDSRATPTPVVPAERPTLTTPATPTDASKDVVIKLKWNDPKFDETVWNTTRYNAIEITDLPRGSSIAHWRDDKGYFFWILDANKKPLDNKLHYYPGNVSKLIVDGKTQDLVAERRKVNDAVARRGGVDVVDGVMTLSFKDPEFNKKLFATHLYDTVNIKDLPAGAKIEFAMDNNGFYFTTGDGKKHHYPPNAKQISVDGKLAHDLGKGRMKSIEDYANANFGGFKNLERARDPVSNMMQVYNFANGMNRQGRAAIEVLKKVLPEAEASSPHNAYFTYMRANLEICDAMAAVVDRVMAGQSTNHPSVLDKLTRADELLDKTIRESDSRLKPENRYPRGNGPLMPLAPWAAYGPDRNGYFYFWGGVWDQASWMKLQVRALRGWVESGVLGLPPERP